MANVGQLEGKVRSKKASLDDYFELADHYAGEAERESDFRKQTKHLKRAAFLAKEAFTKGEADPVRLQRYIAITGSALSRHGWPGSWRAAQSKMIARRLEALGAANATVIHSVKARVNVESATIGVGDLAFPHADPIEMVEAGRRGDRDHGLRRDLLHGDPAGRCGGAGVVGG